MSARPSPLPQPPWKGQMQRADKIIVGGLAFSTLWQLALWPLVPALVASHPALLELLRGSMASVINMGARARVGETSLLLAVFLGIPSLMMFDWLFWWAGKRWGDGVFVWLLGGDPDRTAKRLARLHKLERRFGAGAVVLAYLLPVPSVLIYAAVGDGGMRLRTFLVLDALGTLLWTGLLAAAGYAMGREAVDVADLVAKYSLWATIGISVIVGVYAGRKRGRPPRMAT